MNRMGNTASHHTNEAMAGIVSKEDYRILRGILEKIINDDNSPRAWDDMDSIRLYLYSEEAATLKSTGLLSLESQYALDNGPLKMHASIRELARTGGANFCSDKGVRFTLDIAALKKLVEEVDGKNAVSENDKQEQGSQPQGQEVTWQEREKRRVGIDRHAKVQMEVLMRPEVRPDIIALGVAHGMAGQKYIEHLIVNAINENPHLVAKGEQYIKRAKGGIRRAIALAREEMNLSSDNPEVIQSSSRSI